MAYPRSGSLKHKEEEWGWDGPLRAPIPLHRQCSSLDGRRSGIIHTKGLNPRSRNQRKHKEGSSGTHLKEGERGWDGPLRAPIPPQTELRPQREVEQRNRRKKA